ncbi:MAG: hypothetical protein Unbinned1446contig1005_12 [Prokaryotic dsDNA virus sp.]|nr:MAG: hypothetical protein Unbinned1446contig1005_12 [Prokaryotic dsDNA virus sp.]|tara:strand:+ start:1328 stop:1555 length:228 start_codon:yes stop_codon:yes gene_type:complete
MIDKLIRDLERIGVEVLDAGSDEVMVSAESSDNLEYYPPFQDDPYVSRDLQDVMDDYDAYLEWENAGIAFIVLPY